MKQPHQRGEQKKCRLLHEYLVHKRLVAKCKAKSNRRVVGFVREINAAEQSYYGVEQHEGNDAKAQEPFGMRTRVQRSEWRFLRAHHGRKNGSVAGGDK